MTTPQPNPYFAGGTSAPVDLSGVTTPQATAPDVTSGISAKNFNLQVFTGYAQGGYGPPTQPGEIPYGTGVPYKNMVSSDDLMNRLNGMAPNSGGIKDLQNALFDSAYLNRGDISGHPDDQTRRAYANMLQDVTDYNQQHPDSPMTPDQWMLGTAAAAKTLSGSGAGGRAGGEMTTSSTSVSLTDPITAAVMINKLMQGYQGRGANAQERAQFTAALRSYQAANPSTSSSTVDRSTGMVTRTSMRDRAVNPEAFAQAYATSGKLGVEANTYKVATDYYDAAAKVLQAGGGR